MSTGRTGTINQALGIALIVFVMLTFILTVTTYLFFGQKFQAEQALAAKETERAEAVTEAESAVARTQELADFIKKDLGDKSIDEIRQEFADKFPDYKEQEAGSLTVFEVADWLDKARLESYAGMKAAQTVQATAEAARTKSEQELEAATKSFAEKVAQQDAARKEIEQKAEARRGEFEQAEQKLVAEKQEVIKQIDSARLIVDEIGKGESVLGKAAYEGKDPVTRIGMLIRAIRDRDKTIQVLERTELLGAVAAEDPQVQTYVLEALGATAAEIETLKPLLKQVSPQPAESGAIDGRIVAVDQREQTVTISCDSTFGIRPGLVFNVHPGTLPLGSVRSVKAVVEVVEVEGRSLVRGRIRRDSIEDPILPGDTVSTPLWSPGRSLEAVVVGFVDFNGDGKEDPAPLEGLVRRSGGTIGRSVGPSTTVVVDAGNPGARGGSESRGGLKPAEEKRRNLELAEAKRLGVRVLTLDAFLKWLGADSPVVSSVTAPGPERIPPTPPAAGR